MFAFFQTSFTDFAMLRDALMCWGIYYITECLSEHLKWAVRACLWFHVLIFGRIVKFDLLRNPSDLVYLPLIPLFGWIHSITIKPWALFTLNEVSSCHTIDSFPC